VANNINTKSCMNPKCDLHCKANEGNIRTHGWYKTKTSRRRRYICNACGKSFSFNKVSAYHRLRASKEKINYACHMSAEGVNISAISRILGHSWNTINRWLERARKACHYFQIKHLKGYELSEIQADEIKAFTHANKKKVWILALIEVSTRLWPSVLTGKRNYKNIRKLFGKAINKGNIANKLFVTTDGFTPYSWVLKRMLGPACLYGQVVKKRKKNRITKVDRKVIVGSKEQIADALECSEDSQNLNTSFIERLNLTIRRNTSYLHRKTPAHAQRPDKLHEQLELQQCYYNFMRPHQALRFGSEVYTPAMMAKIADHKVTWAEVLQLWLAAIAAFLIKGSNNVDDRLRFAA